jgi:hypothetical protein
MDQKRDEDEWASEVEGDQRNSRRSKEVEGGQRRSKEVKGSRGK